MCSSDLAARAGNALTFLCAPPGAGLRVGFDRNLDGVPDTES